MHISSPLHRRKIVQLALSTSREGEVVVDIEVAQRVLRRADAHDIAILVDAVSANNILKCESKT